MHITTCECPKISFLPPPPRVSNILRDQWVQMGRRKVWIKSATKRTDGKIQRSFVKHFSLQPTKSKLQSLPHFETTFNWRDMKLRWECFLAQLKAKMLLQRKLTLVKLFIRKKLSKIAFTFHLGRCKAELGKI